MLRTIQNFESKNLKFSKVKSDVLEGQIFGALLTKIKNFKSSIDINVRNFKHINLVSTKITPNKDPLRDYINAYKTICLTPSTVNSVQTLLKVKGLD